MKNWEGKQILQLPHYSSLPPPPTCKDLFSPPCIEIWRGIRPPCPTACSNPGRGWPSTNKPHHPYVLPRQVVLRQRVYAEIEGNPHNWVALCPHCGKGVDDSLEIRPSRRAMLPNLVVQGQTVRALVRTSTWKTTPHVRPFKVTQSHRNRHGSIRHLWLPINVP